MPGALKPRTSLPRVLVGVARMLGRRSMLGWLLKSLAIVAGVLLPLATISTLAMVSAERRAAVAGVAVGVLVVAVALYRAGKWLRREG